MGSNSDLDGKSNLSIFVVSTSSDKPDGATRKLIRSHVMRGRNRRRATASRVKAGSWINGDTSSGDSEDDVDMAKRQLVALPSLTQRSGFEGSGLSVTHFATEMQPYMLDLVFKFFTIIKQSLYPIELCVKFDAENMIWFEYLQFDAMYLHSMMWTSQSYFDWVKGSGKSRAGMIHEARTLHLLQSRLMEPATATSDTTVAVVVALVIMSTLNGHHKTARKHMAGLHKIVIMRGGLNTLKENGQIQIKVCRADLSLALSCGTKPMFFSEGISWEPILPTSNGRRPHLPTQFATLDIDTRLQNILGDLHLFCVSANIAFKTNQKIDPELFQEVLISVVYRLMLLDLHKAGFLETLRLGILAFSTTVFLQTSGIKGRFNNLSRQLQDSISQLPSLSYSTLDEAWLWILFVTAVASVTNEDDEWLMPLLEAQLLKMRLITWEEVRNVLKGILWIDALQDQDGQKVLDQVTLT